ncbi:nuclear transport factor 2 family protein [Streptomyces sp. 8N616]|uniref:nuclear transport factor 2 family protein n=1 Tax=Streptomyces sp. 8N616 TaxID=3457414 RepID=UPI003FD1AB6C
MPTAVGSGTGSALLEEQIRKLVDRSEIAALIDRYVVLLDTQDEAGFDDSWPRSIFTENVRLSFPIGDHEGLDGVAEFHYQAKRKFDRTHHLASNYLIGLDGDRAGVRFHMLATHVHPGEGPLFDIGGHYEGEAVRTAEGWRFQRWAFHLTWSAGPKP